MTSRSSSPNRVVVAGTEASSPGPATAAGTASVPPDLVLAAGIEARVAIAAGVAGASLAVALAVLIWGEPHEDAFILFKYARNLAHGAGIVYFPGGPRTEGATDFLWLQLVAAFQAAHVDVAVGAALLNALGLGAAAWMLTERPPGATPGAPPAGASSFPPPAGASSFPPPAGASSFPPPAGASSVRPSPGAPSLGLERGLRWAFLLVPSALLLASPCAVASYAGFSAGLYSATALFLYRTYVRGPLAWLPALGLVLALLRPDGAILGVCFTLLGAARAVALQRASRRARRFAETGAPDPRAVGRDGDPTDVRRHGMDALPRFLLVSGGSLAMGAAYFIWRFRYFGLPLPLPLYVKSHFAGVPPGLDDLRDWLESTAAPLAGALALARVLLGRSRTPLSPWLLGLAPFAIHVLAFALSVPSQNVGNRFEAPAALALFAMTVATARVRERSASLLHGAGWLAALVLAFVPQIPVAKPVLLTSFEHSYVTRFARAFGAVAPADTRIAITEAGRIPFYMPGRALDLVGLNSAETARRPPDRALLDAFAPDVVMLHPAGMFDEHLIEDARDGRRVIRLEAPIARLVVPWWRPLVRDALPPYDELHTENIRAAVATTLAFLDAHASEYDFFAARFESRYVHYHLYAIRRAWRASSAAVRALEEAERSTLARGYLQSYPGEEQR